MPYEVAALRTACFASHALSPTASDEPKSNRGMDVFRPHTWKIVVLFIATFAGMLCISVSIVL